MEAYAVKVNQSDIVAGIFSLYVSFYIVHTKEHRLALNGGFSIYDQTHYGGVWPAFSVQYLYSLGRIIALSASLKLPVMSKPYEGKVFANPFLTFGIQLF